MFTIKNNLEVVQSEVQIHKEQRMELPQRPPLMAFLAARL
jgi:hypothetical protein